MRKAAFAGLFACACVFTYSPKANAEAFEFINKDSEFQNMVTTPVLATVEPIEESAVKPEQDPVKKAEPKVTKHKVVRGESLDSIARLYNTNWKRLYDKNDFIDNPDLIRVEETITIPHKNEKLKARELPQVQAAATEAPSEPRQAAAVTEPAPRRTAPEQTVRQRTESAPRRQSTPAPAPRVNRGSSSGNTYTAGQCTWHVKNLRGSSLPNGLGNANQWIGRARAMGLPTGSTPRVGAAAVRTYGNHVAYVTAVHDNGTITVSEMNYNWTPYATRSAVKPASDYLYIF